MLKPKVKTGFIVCISNCSTAGLVAPLKPLVDAYGPIELLTATTLQAISGGGFSPGVAGIDVLDNVVPFISGEEEKLNGKPKKSWDMLMDLMTALRFYLMMKLKSVHNVIELLLLMDIWNVFH